MIPNILLLICILITPELLYAETIPINPLTTTTKANIIAGGAIGAVIASDSAYTYYKQNGVPPIITDTGEIFQKAWYAKKIGASLLGDLYIGVPTSDAYVGVNAYIGSTIKDIVDYIKEAGSTGYEYIHGLIDTYSGKYNSLSNPIESGATVESSDGKLYSVGVYNHYGASDKAHVNFNGNPIYAQIGNIFYSLYTFYDTGYLYREVYVVGTPDYNYVTYRAALTRVATGDPVVPIAPATDLDALAGALDVAQADSEITKALGAMPPNAITLSGASSAADINSTPPPSLTAGQINTALATAQSAIANQTAESINSIANANPNSIEAQIAQANIMVELAKAEAEQAKAEAEEIAETPVSVPTSPDWGEIDFSPLLALQGALSTHAPFSWLGDLKLVWDSVVKTPIAPSFNINLGIGSPINIDLARFDDFASTLRAIMSFLLLGLASWLIVRLFGDM